MSRLSTLMINDNLSRSLAERELEDRDEKKHLREVSSSIRLPAVDSSYKTNTKKDNLYAISLTGLTGFT